MRRPWDHNKYDGDEHDCERAPIKSRVKFASQQRAPTDSFKRKIVARSRGAAESALNFACANGRRRRILLRVMNEF